MNKQEAMTMARLVGAAIEPLYAQHGLKVERVNTTYGDGILNLSIKAVSTDPASDPKVTAWKKYAHLYGLPENALGQTIRIKGVAYRITGLDMGRSKFPVAAARLQDNRPYFLTEEGVRKALAGREAVEA